MQKRILIVLIVLIALTAGAFALDKSQAAARAHSFAFTSNASTATVILPAQDASLFAGLEGTELTGDEMMMVEGEGIPEGISLDEGVWHIIAQADNIYIDIPQIALSVLDKNQRKLAQPILNVLNKKEISYRVYHNSKTKQDIVIIWTKP